MSSSHINHEIHNLEHKLEELEYKLTKKEQNEERYQRIVEEMPVFISTFLPDGKLTYVNAALATMIGMAAEKIINLSYFDWRVAKRILFSDTPNDQALVQRMLSSLTPENPIETHDQTHVTAHGELRWQEWTNRAFFDDAGQVTYYQGIGVDITERKLVKEALRESEARGRKIIENSEAGYFFIGIDECFLQVNPAWLRMHKYTSADEVIGKHYSITQVDVDLERASDFVGSLLSGQEVFSGEFSRRCKDGSVGYHTFSARAVMKKGEIIGLEGFLIDTTERKQTEEALHVNEARLRAIIDQSLDGIMLTDDLMRIIEWNPAQTAIFGFTRAEMMGKYIWDFQFDTLPTEQRTIQSVTEFKERMLSSDFLGGSCPSKNIYNFDIESKDGKPKTVQISAFPIALAEVRLYCSISRDVSALYQAEQNYQTLFNEMLDGFALHEIICDEQGNPIDYRFIAVNPAFERQTGLKAHDIIGKTVLEVLPGTEKFWIETYGRVALSGEPAVFENDSEEIGKHFVVTAYRAATNQFACIFNDISERKQAEMKINEQLDELQHWYNITLEREERILELKSEINRLLVETGKPVRFTSTQIALTDERKEKLD